MKRTVTAVFVLLSFSLSAQTLFYYGNDSVSVNDFLKAYRKNNTGPQTGKAFLDYLDLYVASRLKIREAKARGYDTLPQMVADLENLRQQILPAYLNDKAAVDRLIREALTRSKKDIRLAHIFISTAGGEDKAKAALAELQQGKDFATVARKYSDDPSVKNNGGTIGWITVFDLPYELENLAYATPPGKISAIHRSRAGFHIFKNEGERPDLGRLKVSEILLAFPPGENQEKPVKKLADSLYNRLMKGDDFGKLAARFSNDVVSANANGQVQEFGVGQYEPTFENVAFALKKDGEISKPFLTSHGWHILKRNSRKALAWNTADKKSMDDLRNKVEQSDRIATTKTALANRILKDASYKKGAFSDTELWTFTDSVINYKAAGRPLAVTNSTLLFQLGDKKVTAADWISFALTFRYKTDGSGLKPYGQLWDEFVEAMAIDYYQNHLENFNEDFRQQINEFSEGNLFFEIMQQQIWGPAQSDSLALLNYYNHHKEHYTWNASADAVIFYVSDAETARTFATELRKDPSNWKALVVNFSEKVAADSARFELAQLPNKDKSMPVAGRVTAPVINQNDKTASLAYVIHTYPRGGLRSFAEARGIVINDYQAELEKDWIAELKKKYPVKINQDVLEALVKNEAK